MSWRSDDFRCKDDACGHVTTELYRRSDGIPQVKCSLCGGVTEKTFAAPLVLSASWPDGYKRGGSWEAARRQSKLEGQFDKARDHKDKMDIQKEFRRVGGKDD